MGNEGTRKEIDKDKTKNSTNTKLEGMGLIHSFNQNHTTTPKNELFIVNIIYMLQTPFLKILRMCWF